MYIRRYYIIAGAMNSFFCRSWPRAWQPPGALAFADAMTLPGQYDEATFDLSRGDFDGVIMPNCRSPAQTAANQIAGPAMEEEIRQ